MQVRAYSIHGRSLFWIAYIYICDNYIGPAFGRQIGNSFGRRPARTLGQGQHPASCAGVAAAEATPWLTAGGARLGDPRAQHRQGTSAELVAIYHQASKPIFEFLEFPFSKKCCFAPLGNTDPGGNTVFVSPKIWLDCCWATDAQGNARLVPCGQNGLYRLLVKRATGNISVIPESNKSCVDPG